MKDLPPRISPKFEANIFSKIIQRNKIDIIVQFKTMTDFYSIFSRVFYMNLYMKTMIIETLAFNHIGQLLNHLRLFLADIIHQGFWAVGH